MNVEIVEYLDRLKDFYVKFDSDVEENILLREFYFAFSNLIEYLDYLGSEPDLDQLEKRIKVLESSSSNLKDSAKKLNQSLNKFETDLPNLENEDKFISNKIDLLELEDEKINELIDSILTNSNEEFEGLDSKDVEIRERLDSDVEETKDEIYNRKEIIEEMDINVVERKLEDLKLFDVVIKGTINDNHTYEKELLDIITVKIDDSEIKEDLVNLKGSR